MRLPLAIPIDSRNSDETIDARMSNMLVEQYEDKNYVVSRAALSKLVDQSGAANGVMAFNGELISLFGTTINQSFNSIDTWDAAISSSGTQSGLYFKNGRLWSSGGGGSLRYSDDFGITWTNIALSNAALSSAFASNGNVIVSVWWDVFGTALVSSLDNGATWSVRASPAFSVFYQDVVFGNGLFVAVSNTGSSRVAYSYDGITWFAASASEANSWSGIAYGNGLFVAVASTGTNRVMTSPDGINWTARSAAEANQWADIVYGDGVFVAVSTDGTNRVMTSPDGITWTARSAAEANQWAAIAYGNKTFVAVSANGTNRAMVSNDGITWSSSTPASQSWSEIAFGDGRFFILDGGNFRFSKTSIVHNLNAIDTVADGDYDFAQTST